jgi:hypothetical protein
MRAATLICLALFAAGVPACSKKPADKIIGEWKGTDTTGETASVILAADHTFRMVRGNLVLDGPTLGGKLEWRIDTTHDPMALDVIATKSSGEHFVIIAMIARFVTDQKLQLRFSPDTRSRPTGFSASDTTDQIIVTKQ